MARLEEENSVLQVLVDRHLLGCKFESDLKFSN